MVSVSVGGVFSLGINDGQVDVSVLDGMVDVNVGGGSGTPSTTQDGSIESPDSSSDETGTEEAFNVSDLAPGDEGQSIDDSLSLGDADGVLPTDNEGGNLSDIDQNDMIDGLQQIQQIVTELLSKLGAAPSPVGSLPMADAQQGGISLNSGGKDPFDLSSFSDGPIGAETLAGGGLKTPAPNGLADAGGPLNVGTLDGLAAANGSSDIGNTDLMSEFPSTGQGNSGFPQALGGGSEGDALLTSINDRLVSIETMFAQLIGINPSI